MLHSSLRETNSDCRRIPKKIESESLELQTLIRLADRKGILRGDLNGLQERALLWLISEDFTISTELEKERMKYTLLAGNPQLYEQLYQQDDDGAPDDADVEWMVPESVDEVEDVLNFLQQTQTQRESGI